MKQEKWKRHAKSPRQSLDDAQLAKKRHVVAKLLVPPHGREAIPIASSSKRLEVKPTKVAA
jgi:predicted alpha/beta hydrolase